jgi:hypothetical protein
LKNLKVNCKRLKALVSRTPTTQVALKRSLTARGYKIVENKMDFRIQDCTEWYWTNSEPILAVAKTGCPRLEIVCVGDLRIYGRRKHFVFRGGNPDGQLTRWIKEHGDWENNNWFEVHVVTGEEVWEEDIHYELNEAVETLLELCDKQISEQ